MAYYIAKDVAPIATVEQDGVIQLLKTMNPQYQIPSHRYFIREALPKIHIVVRASPAVQVYLLDFIQEDLFFTYPDSFFHCFIQYDIVQTKTIIRVRLRIITFCVFLRVFLKEKINRALEGTKITLRKNIDIYRVLPYSLKILRYNICSISLSPTSK